MSQGTWLTLEQGPNDKNTYCDTCGEEATRCVGHYGYIKLLLPVFHVGYFRPTINMLSCICKVCIPYSQSRTVLSTSIDLFEDPADSPRTSYVPHSSTPSPNRKSTTTSCVQADPRHLQETSHMPLLRPSQWDRQEVRGFAHKPRTLSIDQDVRPQIRGDGQLRDSDGGEKGHL